MLRSAASWSDEERAFLEIADIFAAYPDDAPTALQWFLDEARTEGTA